MKALFFLLVLVCIAFARKYDRDSYNAQVELGVSSISTALSYVPLPLNETAIYNYTIPGDSQYGMITHWWLTGDVIENTILRFYVDDENVAAVQYTVDNSIGIAFRDNNTWGTVKIGKNAATGGVYNNIRIPFQKCPSAASNVVLIVALTLLSFTLLAIYITIQGFAESRYFWIMRGLVSQGAYLPITVGGMDLPRTAKLHVYSILNQTFPPLAKVALVNVTNSAGVLYLVTMAVNSTSLEFLEGCVRCFIDGGPQMLVSSGTEDYFDSAYYFNGGSFQGPNAGTTHLDWWNSTFAGYRFHDEDPLFFNNNFQLIWRNSDTTDPVTGQKCIDDNGTQWSPKPSTLTSLAWVYQW